MLKRLSHHITALSIIATVCSCAPQQPIRLIGEAQGTYYTIIYYDKEQRNLHEAIDSLLKDFDMTASLWEESSLIRRVNRNEDSIVNSLYADMLQKSVDINCLTGGKFDCTIGPLVNAWGFGFKNEQLPSAQTIDSLRQYTGVQPRLDTSADGQIKIIKPSPFTEIDFNAIAQGYTSDMVAKFLENKGIDSYIVDIGGEVIAHGYKPNGESWVVGVEQPAKNKYSSPEIALSVRLDNMAVVTSGSYRKYHEKDGMRYSHTIDPSTGYPVNHTLLSVTVIDTTSWRADALATAFMVMGKDSSLAFMESHPEAVPTKAVMFIYSEGDENKIYSTKEFTSLIKNRQRTI